MALDFYRLDNNSFLFGLNDRQYNDLKDIFDTFTQWTGIVIDPYSDIILTTENQEALIRIIDKYVDKTDLNKDRRKTSVIIEFKGLIGFFSNNRTDLKLLGD